MDKYPVADAGNRETGKIHAPEQNFNNRMNYLIQGYPIIQLWQ
jgi:hypothetical protein